MKYASIAAIALLIGTFSLGLGVANNSSSLWVPFPDSDAPRTFGIPLLLGREFNKADAPNATRVIIINEAFAAKVYPGEDPVGKVLHCNGARELGGVLAYSVTFFGATVIFLVVAMAACVIPAIPAIRAMRVHP